MDAVNELIRRDRALAPGGVKILVTGDAMRDEWYFGDFRHGNNGERAFVAESHAATPGGSANAARQLAHWNGLACLAAPVGEAGDPKRVDGDGLYSVEYGFFEGRPPVKTRFIDRAGRLAFRCDGEAGSCGLPPERLAALRASLLSSARGQNWGAVLISDYDKGWLDGDTLRKLIGHCALHKIPCVADARRRPALYEGAVLKCNEDYCAARRVELERFPGPVVVTRGPRRPRVRGGGDDDFPAAFYTELATTAPGYAPGPCVNHVGAGDCFSAHLALGLALGMGVVEASRAADCASRAFVRRPLGAPPWPHELRREADPVMGKVVQKADLAAVRRSVAGGRLVAANGVFRLLHGGHAWLLDWARRQGDCLVALVNDDAGAADLRPGQYVLPLSERVRVLAGLSCVDWVASFPGKDPCPELEALGADVLVKGDEYRGKPIPGGDLVGSVRFAPPSPHGLHAQAVAEGVRLQGG